MPTSSNPNARPRLAPLGILFVLITSVAWGLNWPSTKYLISELPPLPARGLAGLIGGAALGVYAWLRGDSLVIPQDQRMRLLVSAFLNVTMWMAVMGFALLWLPAGEASVIAYTMPVWTALLAWPLLGERLVPIRLVALVLAFTGLVILFSGEGIDASIAKWPGVALALLGAIAFALGTIFLKRYPLQLPGATSAAWQLVLGCLPVAIVGFALDQPSFANLSPLGWACMAYMTFVGLSLAYMTWFAALERLPASVAAIGTMLVPVIGVVASAIILKEPLGLVQVAALALTLGGVTLAARS